MKAINHKYIIKVYEILSSTQKIIFVMEYIEGGELFDEIKNGEDEKLTEEKSRYYYQQIITALEYCHNKNIIHRDLKPENILIDKKENCIKISDFGLATILKEKNEKLNDFCGTTNYIAPEIIKETGGIFSNGGYKGQPADIWSSGVILYNMVSGENPFYNRNKTVRINNILNANTQPQNRFTIKDIKKHSWFVKNFVDINQISNYGNMVKVDYINSKSFFIGENDIRKLNSFEFISMIAGKWLNNMFFEHCAKIITDNKSERVSHWIKELWLYCGWIQYDRIKPNNKPVSYNLMRQYFFGGWGHNYDFFKRDLYEAYIEIKKVKPEIQDKSNGRLAFVKFKIFLRKTMQMLSKQQLTEEKLTNLAKQYLI